MMKVDVPTFGGYQEVPTKTWDIIHMIELPQAVFHKFKNNLLDDKFEFIKFHVQDLYATEEGVIKGMLVLCEGEDDGILVSAYRRSRIWQSALLPGARMWMIMNRYPSLRNLCLEMDKVVNKYAFRAAFEQGDTPDFEPFQELERGQVYMTYRHDFPVPDQDLFLSMLSERPEFTGLEFNDDGEMILTLDLEYLRKELPEALNGFEDCGEEPQCLTMS